MEFLYLLTAFMFEPATSGSYWVLYIKPGEVTNRYTCTICGYIRTMCWMVSIIRTDFKGDACSIYIFS